MAVSDIPPEGAPWWLIYVSMGLVAAGAACWNVTYVLMVFKTLETQFYSMPVLALSLNASWELIYLFVAIADGAHLETLGLLFWAVLDVVLVWATIFAAPNAWYNRRTVGLQVLPLRFRNAIGKHMGIILPALLVVGATVHACFFFWWMSQPGRGSGDKAGKFFRGSEGYDLTELAFWTAGGCQFVVSLDSLRMLIDRQHSKGASYTIWAFRFAGSILGLGLSNLLLWWYWPEAHGYFVSPLAMTMAALSVLCDLLYVALLRRMRTREADRVRAAYTLPGAKLSDLVKKIA